MKLKVILILFGANALTISAPPQAGAVESGQPNSLAAPTALHLNLVSESPTQIPSIRQRTTVRVQRPLIPEHPA